MQYRKKPVIIEAIPWDSEENIIKIKEWLGHNLGTTEKIFTTSYFIKTLEGDMAITFGDYIIQGVNGEFYPCKPDIFEKSYEQV
jgi:hypothetical protein